MSGLRIFLTPLVGAIIAIALQNTTPALASTPLITSSVKLRVDADNGHSWGTGTIIDTREGEALILTCGHIFREWTEGKNIEVHLFGENSTVRTLGEFICCDLEIDLALVAITPPFPVRAVPIAPLSYRMQPLQQTWSVGCDHGGNPTVRTHQIISTDRVSTPREHRVPFHYVQIAGAPVGGRSGGGLFSSEGYLIGVCNAGDPIVDDGHFVPPHIVRHFLDKNDLAHIHQNPSLGTPARAVVQTPQAAPPTSPALAVLAPLTPMESMPNGLLPNTLPNTPPMAAASTSLPMYAENKSVVAGSVATGNITAGGGVSREEQATLEEIKRRKQDGDEVILIVRSRRNPEIPSDVIILNGTSDQFLDALVKNPPSNPAYNSVIFSSHEREQSARTADRQPVSFPVKY